MMVLMIFFILTIPLKLLRLPMKIYQPSLTDGDPEDEGFTGIAGDVIEITVTTNQQISVTSP